MVTNNGHGFTNLFISVQTKKGMSEDSTHRKPLLYLGARRVICRWHITQYKTTAMRCLVLRLCKPQAQQELSTARLNAECKRACDGTAMPPAPKVNSVT